MLIFTPSTVVYIRSFTIWGRYYYLYIDVIAFLLQMKNGLIRSFVNNFIYFDKLYKKI